MAWMLVGIETPILWLRASRLVKAFMALLPKLHLYLGPDKMGLYILIL
jgi:hypothetical protein